MTSKINGKKVDQIITGNDEVFGAEAIRDTNDHDSIVSDNTKFAPKTVFVENGLDQTVTIQMQGAAIEDFSEFVDIGNSFNVSATSNDYQTITDYFPFVRARATCSTSPTTGGLTVCILKRA
jgi:glutamate synthase domain-containing protein 3